MTIISLLSIFDSTALTLFSVILRELATEESFQSIAVSTVKVLHFVQNDKNGVIVVESQLTIDR